MREFIPHNAVWMQSMRIEFALNTHYAIWLLNRFESGFSVDRPIDLAWFTRYSQRLWQHKFWKQTADRLWWVICKALKQQLQSHINTYTQMDATKQITLLCMHNNLWKRHFKDNTSLLHTWEAFTTNNHLVSQGKIQVTINKKHVLNYYWTHTKLHTSCKVWY